MEHISTVKQISYFVNQLDTLKLAIFVIISDNVMLFMFGNISNMCILANQSIITALIAYHATMQLLHHKITAKTGRAYPTWLIKS